MSSCCGGKCGCGSGCKCGSGCNGCGYSFNIEENTTGGTIVMGVAAAPKVQYGHESGVAAEGGSSGCKCVNCTCDPCTCK